MNPDQGQNTRPRIGLVYPFIENSDLQIPLGIGYLASYLREKMPGVEIHALDTGIATQRETQQFLDREFDVIGFSVSSRSYRDSINILRQYKHLHPHSIVLYGGPHVSMMKSEVLDREPMIDYVVDGEGEVTFHELIAALHDSDYQPDNVTLSGIDGLIWRDGNQVVTNPERSLVQDLDSLPYPAFDLFPVERYPSQYPLTSSRGCPFRCTFCTVVTLWGNRQFRVHSAKRIVDEIEERIRTYGPRPVVIHDDAINTRLQRMDDICLEMINRKLRIPFSIRGFRIDILNEYSAALLRKAGCASVAIGVECANNEMLDRMQKSTTVEILDKGITMLRRQGIDVIGQFMIGNPGETPETVQDSLDFAAQTDLSKATFCMAVPFPKTPLWDYAEQAGRYLVEKDVTYFDNVIGKVIFETPEFTLDQRIQARETARERGFLYHRVEKKPLRRRFRDFGKAVWYRTIYPRLPRSISWRLNFLLREFVKGGPVSHDSSDWAQARGINPQSVRMKGELKQDATAVGSSSSAASH